MYTSGCVEGSSGSEDLSRVSSEHKKNINDDGDTLGRSFQFMDIQGGTKQMISLTTGTLKPCAFKSFQGNDSVRIKDLCCHL